MIAETPVLGLLHNIALLLAVVLIYDVLIGVERLRRSTYYRVLAGFVIGAIGVMIMLTPVVYLPGVIFDTRSILLSISGLFFGTLPTVIAMLITATLRILQGGPGAIPGVLVIISTGTLGIAFRHSRKRQLDKLKWRELYVFGVITHVVMMLMMLLLPPDAARRVIPNIGLPVLTLFPLGSVLVGGIMVNRMRREQYKQLISKTSARLNATQKLARLGGWEWDVQQRSMIWSDEVFRIHGFERDELAQGSPELIRKSMQCYDEGDRATIQAAFENCIANGVAYKLELPFTTAQGRRIWIQTMAEPVWEDGSVVRVLGNIMDITERKQADQAVRESEEKYRLVADFTYDWESWFLPDGMYRYVSPSCERITGRRAEEFLAEPGLLRRIVHPDDAHIIEHHFQYVRSQARNESLETEFRIVRPDGEIRWIGHSCTPVFGQDGQWLGRRESNRDITHNKQAEARIRADQVELQRLLDEAERSRQALLSVIEDQKHAEDQVRRLNAELEQRVAERTNQLTRANQELEAFSYSVSHDLRAPLRALDGFSDALATDYRDVLDEQGRHYLARIQDASRRMSQLIEDLLNLSRITRREMKLTQVDLGGLAQQVAADLESQFQAGERLLQFEIASGLSARADPNLIKIVFENLLRNAIKFSGGRSPARIEVGARTQLGERAYYVRDNGVGFDMAHADKLFAPFQRLHSAREFPGSGIGLSIVQRIIARHGGRVWAEAALDQGATIYFTLPDTQRWDG